MMGAGAFAIGAGDEAIIRFNGEGQVFASVLGHEGVADGEKVVTGFGAAHLVEEAAFGFDPEPDEVEKLFHMINAVFLGEIGVLNREVELVDVYADVAEAGTVDRLAGKQLTDLAKDPGVADGMAADHDASGAGVVEDVAGLFSAEDIAVGEHGAGKGADGPADKVVVDLAPITFLDGAAVKAEEIDLVFLQEFKEPGEGIGVLKADPHLYGEPPSNGFAEGSKHLIDFVRIAEQATTDVFLVYLGGGASHVEIDPGKGVLLEFASGSAKVVKAFPDQLREDGASGSVLEDGTEDVFFEGGVLVNAKIFGKEKIGATATGDHLHELKGGHVLHRGERGVGLAGQNTLRQGGHAEWGGREKAPTQGTRWRFFSKSLT